MLQSSDASAHPFSILQTETPSDSFPPLGPNIKVLMVWPRFPLA